MSAGLQGVGAEAQWIHDRLRLGWMDGSPATERTPIAWDNTGFSPPNPAAPWIRPTIRRAGGGRASLGPEPWQRFDATLVIEVFTPAMQGTEESDELCDALEALFREARTTGLRFGTPYTVTVGSVSAGGGTNVGEGGWFKQDVLCPYVRDTIFASP